MGMSREDDCHRAPDPDPDQPLDFSIGSRRRNEDAPSVISPLGPPASTTSSWQQQRPLALPYIMQSHLQLQQQPDVVGYPPVAALGLGPLRLPVPEPGTGLWLQGLADAAAYSNFRQRFLNSPTLERETFPERVDSGNEVPLQRPVISPGADAEDEEDEEEERRGVAGGNGNSQGNGNSHQVVVKDEAYWERRRKNNEAAKRSRDARRAKEDEIAIRAAFLEQENLKLRVEVAALKTETAKLRCMLYNS